PARGIESWRETQNSAACLRPRISAVGRHVLEIFRDRKLNLNQRPWLRFLPGNRGGVGEIYKHKERNEVKAKPLHVDNESDSIASCNSVFLFVGQAHRLPRSTDGNRCGCPT